MATHTGDSPTFAVEGEFFGGQARLVPQFDSAALEGPNQARYGQLRNEVRSDGETIILPHPMGEGFDPGERVTLREVYRRVSDSPSAGFNLSDKMIATVAIACSLAVCGVSSMVRTLFSHR